MDVKYIVVTGNPFDGLHCVGPFDTYDEAAEFGDCIADNWNVAELHPVAAGA